MNGSCAGTPIGGAPQQVTVMLSPAVLAPANHRLVPIEATVTAFDSCGGSVPVVLTSIISSEPDDAAGTGDGSTRQDIRDAMYGTVDFRFRVRAERDGNGGGRIYLVTYTATSASGQSASGSSSIFVPRGSPLAKPGLDIPPEGGEMHGRTGHGQAGKQP